MKPKVFFPFLLLFISLLSKSSCKTSCQELKRSRKHFCPIFNGNPSVLCSSQFNNICAYFIGGDCGSQLCPRLTSNGCTACLDSSVKYYQEQSCRASKVYCDPNVRPELCPKRSSPVCGYFSSSACPGGLCSVTALNPCEVCRDSRVEYYRPGPCKNPTEFYCSWLNEDESCNDKEKKPVCAYFTKGCPSGTCNKTMENACTACRDPSVLYYKDGICQNETYTCLMISARPETCPFDYNPVCAGRVECTEPECSRETRTFENLCLACRSPGYLYFATGVCEEDKLVCPSFKSEAKDCPQTEEPVCAVFKEDLSNEFPYTDRRTYSNGCLACAVSSPKYYTEGPCKRTCREMYGDGVIIDCIGEAANPVCGLNSEGCRDPEGGCQENFENSCLACSSGRVVQFTDGACS